MKRFLVLLTVATAAIAQPSVIAVLDAGAYTNDIAQGSVFVVKGTGLSAAGLVQATAPIYPTALNSVSLTLTAATGGTVVRPLMVYTYNLGGVNQLAAVLPSNAALGAYDLKVANGSATSAAFRTNVVARKPGIVTASSDGAGQAQATLDGKLILQRTSNVGKIDVFTTRSAHPGERVDLWGTGLGPDLASDTGGTSGDQTTAGTIRVLVDGIEVTPAYAGRSQGYPGLDQIAFTLPATTAVNCAVTLQVRAGTVFSNPVTIATATNESCTPGTIRINEVESNGGVPGDWVELYNPTTAAVNIGGYGFKDNDETHALYVIPASTSIPAGGYYMLEEAAFAFGLGAADSARLYNPGGTLIDSYSWTAHAANTYGRCPNGTGSFINTFSSTKSTTNDCGINVKINEVESNGGDPGDWVELYNAGTVPANVGGYGFRDNDDTHALYVIPAGTTIPVGGYLVLEEAQFLFGLGAADSARIYDPSGGIADTYSWTAHATTTYGRCPNGTGDFVTTAASTKGTANACGSVGGGSGGTSVKINEVESNGGTPGDWFELLNIGTIAADLSGWKMLDNDDTHAPYVFPAGSTLAAGGYLVVEEAQFVFGLGAADSVRIFDSTGKLYETYSWTAHAAITYGRCPNGTGDFADNNSSTKGAANDCGNPVKINEVESDSGTPGDWVELYNPGNAPVSVAGLIFRDNDNTHGYTIPTGTTIAAGGYYILEEAAFGFGLDAADSVRLFTATGTLVDSYTWPAHATTTYGRCPNGTGAFVATTAPTKGALNACTGDVTYFAWPGSATIQIVDLLNAFPSNLSGLIYEGSAATTGVLWGARNGPGGLFRLLFDGTNWVPDTANSWSAGKLLHYPDGTGDPDSEGVTFAGTGSAGGIFISTERNNSNNAVSRIEVLRFDPAATGASLNATHEWNLTADLPVSGANLGAEGITWIPDTFLTSKNFFDEAKNRAYNPTDYPNHGTGIFFIGLESNGNIYAYALDQGGTTFTRVATIVTGFPAVMDLQFDRELNDLWAVCDDTCQGRSAVLRMDSTGKFTVARRFERPTGMPNINNEGFAIAPAAQCIAGFKPVFWSDDNDTDGHAIRSGTIACTTF